MFVFLIVLCVMYIFSCVTLIGFAELSALNKYEQPIRRDVIMDMLSHKFYIIWFLPWWLLFVGYRLAQMRRGCTDYTLPRAEPVTQEYRAGT
jgi:hypothetical protein